MIFMQVLVKKRDRDDRIVRLAHTMSDTFAIVQDTASYPASDDVRILHCRIRQTTENL